MIKIKQGLFLMWAAIFHSGIAAAQYGHTPDKQEILMMPQMCQWMHGARAGMDPKTIPRSPGIDLSGCKRNHYYCWAHLDLVRAEKNAYTNAAMAKERFDRAIRTLKGQVQHHNSTPGCSKYLRADVSYTLGKALERYAGFTKSKRYYSEAIGPLLHSIELTPDDVRPYQVLGDVYFALDKRKEAEEAIYRGLEINPESKLLLRRYEKVGGNRPLPTRKPPAPVDALQPKGAPSLDTNEKKPVGAHEVIAPGINNNPVENKFNPVETTPEEQPARDGSSPPRSCRFCADNDDSKNNAPPAPNEPEGQNPASNKSPCRFCP